MQRWAIVGLILVMLLAACGSDDPSKTVHQGPALFSLTFDEAGSWEEGSFPAESPTSTLAIVDGRYQIDHTSQRNASFVWGAGGEPVEDVVIEVETEQLSADKDNLYGVICRLEVDEDGSASGYALLISGDGHYGIADFSDDTLDFVLAWHQSDAIEQGQSGNTIRAACVGDYLAIYANGRFLGEVKNNGFRRAGQVALIAGSAGGQPVRVAFDNLRVFEGSLE